MQARQIIRQVSSKIKNEMKDLSSVAHDNYNIEYGTAKQVKHMNVSMYSLQCI